MDILNKLSLIRGSQLTSRRDNIEYLSFGGNPLDDFFHGGIPKGELSEFGMPLGGEGRLLILKLLAANMPQNPFVLWVLGDDNLKINPSSWSAHGIDLSRIRFAGSIDPIKDLHAVFQESLFKVIILDSIPALKKESMAFLATQARVNQLTILFVRPYFLRNDRGNIWAGLRTNCWKEPGYHTHRVEIIRGLSPRKLEVAL